MPREHLRIERRIAAAPDRTWAVARDFGAAWHPQVAHADVRIDERGTWLRSLTLQGEDTPVRERLTGFSDTDRWLSYALVDGLSQVEAYEAMLSVDDDGQGSSRACWFATMQAPAPRLQGLCAGTRAVFETGLDALARRAVAPGHPGPSTPAMPAPVAIDDDVRVDGDPPLALSCTPATGARRLCLFLHGIGGGRHNWRDQLGLAGRVMPAAAMDLRGYGDSRLGTLPSTVDDHCRDILRVMAFLGAERLVLVGLSFGAWIATSFAMRHPALLDGLVLSGGCTGLSEVDSAARDAFRRARTAPLDAGQRPGDLAAAVVPALLGPTAGDPVRRALWASMAAIPTATYRDAVACFTRPTERFDFSRFAFPVLLVTGEHDRLATPTEIRSVARRITRHAPTAEVRFELIADAGHVCNLEQPEAYGRLLLDFLGRWS